MKFIIDAQLPIKLKTWLVQEGNDCLHTNDLPQKEFSTDEEIMKFAEQEHRIVITKDSDFYKHFLITGFPKKILFVTTGNVTNTELIRVFELNFQTIETHFNLGKKVIELSTSYIKVLR